MELFLQPYHPTILAVGATGTLLLIQLLVADILSISAKHVPGTPVEPDHNIFLFRAHRAAANTNESVAALVLGVLFCLAVSAPPHWLNGLSWVYVAGRAGHMLCYYLNLKRLRSALFGVSFVALFGFYGLGAYAYWF